MSEVRHRDPGGFQVLSQLWGSGPDPCLHGDPTVSQVPDPGAGGCEVLP
jgi:hypothetical protein